MPDIRRAKVLSFDTATWTATVALTGEVAGTLVGVGCAAHLDADQLAVGNTVAVWLPDAAEPATALVLAANGGVQADQTILAAHDRLDAILGAGAQDDVYPHANLAGSQQRADWWNTPAEHMNALPAGWSWVNDPTGTAGLKTCSASLLHLSADDTNKASYYLKAITTWSGKSARIVLAVEYNAEGGIHLDDGTLNNYLQVYLQYQTGGLLRVCRRQRTGGGTPAQNVMLSDFPFAMYGLRQYVSSASSGIWSLYLFKDVPAESMLLWATGAFAFTPARVGFFSTKGDAGTGRGAYIDWWTDSFT
jgi:hypothetical protein